MASAEFVVVHAGPLVTIQDSGRPGLMRYGVPASGPMDRRSHVAANRALGNSSNATAIEVSIGGLIVQCTKGSVTVAVCGGGFQVDIGGLGGHGPIWRLLEISLQTNGWAALPRMHRRD